MKIFFNFLSHPLHLFLAITCSLKENFIQLLLITQIILQLSCCISKNMAAISSNNSSSSTAMPTHAPQENKHQQQEQQQQKSSGNNVYESTKLAINECIKQLNEFTNSLNEVCNRANLLAQSLQSLENVATPEVIGSSTYLKAPKNIFDCSAHLCEVSHSLQE